MDIPDRFGERFHGQSPARLGFLLWLAAFLAMASTLILIGLFITHGPLHDPIARWDQSVTRWFADHETPAWTSDTNLGSDLGMTQVVTGVGLLVMVVLAILRRWRDLAFLFTALTLEASVALTSSIVVDRPRPSLIRLAAVPPTRSFPSGHTAASIALYVGLAVILTPHVRPVVARLLIWLVALLLPIYVGVSRVYEGMHHATDVLGSLVLGILALWAAWLVVACTASAWRHQHRTSNRPMLIEPTYHPAEAGP